MPPTHTKDNSYSAQVAQVVLDEEGAKLGEVLGGTCQSGTFLAPTPRYAHLSHAGLEDAL